MLPEISRARDAHGHTHVSLRGHWNLIALGDRFESLRVAAERMSADRQVGWDLRPLGALDGSGALLLWQVWGRRLPQRIRMRPEHAALFAQLEKAGSLPGRPPRARLGLRLLGAALLGFADHLTDGVRLVGQLFLDLGRIVRYPALIGWREISANVYRTGAQALGITALVGALVGVTLSYLSSRQLQSYGADIYVIDLLGISVWRELGPLLAAILIAGRSGASMTAQLGVMRVTQELDALSVLGISHTVRLVLPKVVALAISAPLVVLWTSMMTLLGGMVAARRQLGIEYVQFLQRLPSAVPIANLWLGLTKAAVFGALIALIACHFGLRIRPNSESLGQGTTLAVVTSITAVIIVDAIFAVLFSDIGFD
jgi:phospholipid/cholesterol/gamma-HCH transport system permease protein